MLEIIERELVYIVYYLELQIRQILFWYIFGVVAGSLISVFLKQRILSWMEALGRHTDGLLSIVLASLLGIASPLCMYGTIPIAASLERGGIRQSSLASFMMASILLNPQLIIYSFALGSTVVWIRIVSCFIMAVAAGLVVRFFGKPFMDFSSVQERADRDTDPRLVLRIVKNIGRNFRATGPWFLFGVLLSALFQRYVPSDLMGRLFGPNEGFGVLLAATIGVPLYACGGGTIPLLQAWLMDGMSLGSATAFMLTGPSTKITNLGALKIVLPARRFLIYLGFVIICSLVMGSLVNVVF